MISCTPVNHYDLIMNPRKAALVLYPYDDLFFPKSTLSSHPLFPQDLRHYIRLLLLYANIPLCRVPVRH